MKPESFTTFQKIVLMLSLPATFLFFYFLFKKEKEENEDTASTKMFQMRVTPHLLNVLLQLHEAQIKTIQKQTRTKISFNEGSKYEKDNFLLISGSSDGVRQAELLVRQLLKEYMAIISERIYVPRSAVKIILGMNRENVRNIGKSSEAKIIINRTEARTKDKPFIEVELRGTVTSVESTKKMIMDMVSLEKNASMIDVEDVTRDITDLSLSVCFVTAVEHPGHFWIQKFDSSDGCVPNQLDDLTKKMNDFYSSGLCDINTCCDLNLGDMVALNLPHDNWYRAEVKEIVKDDLVLYLVDFGDTVIASYKDVTLLSINFLTLPFQAIECCLANIMPSGVDWTEAATKEFEKIICVGKRSPLMFKIIDQQWDVNKAIMSVMLFNDSEQSFGIADQLVSKGFARHCTDAVNTFDSSPKAHNFPSRQNKILKPRVKTHEEKTNSKWNQKLLQ